MTEQRFWTLISLKLTQSANHDELDELETFLEDRPEMRLRAGTMENFWNAQQSGSDKARKEAFNRHLQRLRSTDDESGFE